MAFTQTFQVTPNFAVVTGALTATIPVNAHEWSVKVLSGSAVLNGSPLEAGKDLYSAFTLISPIVVSGVGTAPKAFVHWSA